MKDGHTSGTPPPQTLERTGRERRTGVHQSAVPGWPRLLNIYQAAAYLGISVDMVREFINDGTIKPVRLPRPRTARMNRRTAISDQVRRLLIDRADLDKLVERWQGQGVIPGGVAAGA